MITHPLRLAAAVAGLGLLAACTSSATSGKGSAVHQPSSHTDFPSQASAPAGSGSPVPSSPPASSSSSAVSSSSAPPAPHPAPANPLRTVTVHAADNQTYVVKLWAKVDNPTCVGHAYGAPVIAFLKQHACTGLTRYLGTTTVNGRAVGFAESSTGFVGTSQDPYVYTGQFRELVTKDGTGSINDLLREGYRLPSGPTSVPSPDAFNCVGQDVGVTIWDVWYLSGPTPNNDPALVQMTEDLFLQY